jgi:haloalkane dehalogenase
MALPAARRSEEPFAQKKFLDVHGRRMAYIDEGEGPAIVFQHGNPTSSYLWRNVLPHLEGLGRLVAADLIGMGDSDKLPAALGPERYSYDEHRRYLFGLLESLDLGDNVVLVLHDVGSQFGFDWANQHRDRVRGIAYMESIVAPLRTTDFPEQTQAALKTTFGTPEGRDKFISSLAFLDNFLLATRAFSEAEQAYYRRPFLVPGEDRRSMIFDFSIDGIPEHTAKVVESYSSWLAKSDVPKLMIRANPGYLLKGRLYDFAKTWPNQTEVTVDGLHYIQESAPDEVGKAVAEFVRRLPAR